ncbi:replicative DNA helicase [Rhizorhabdus histidinilytica]|uniref:replicative DNA helicase n=1 Tax=Rhizorhabdus histidinilytica TaxID=439228 RepID=UPI0032209C7D
MSIDPVARLVNIEAEEALIGSMLSDNRQIDSVVDRMRAEDLAHPVLASIFSAACLLHAQGQAATPVTIKPYIDTDPAFQAWGGMAALAGLTGQLHGPALAFVDQITSLASRRRLCAGLHDTLARVGDLSQSLEGLIDSADSAIYEATATGDAIAQPSVDTVLRGLVDRLDEPQKGVKCGLIPSLDAQLGPLAPKNLVIAAGRPGMGKTAAALTYARGVAEQGFGVLFFSLEMSADELVERMVADINFDGSDGIPYDAIVHKTMNAYQRQIFCRTLEYTERLPFHIVDAGSLTVTRLAMIVRRWKRRFAARNIELALVVVDYLQLLQPGAGSFTNRNEAVGSISRTLKATAKDNDVAIMALSQLSRQVETREDKRPVMQDLRESGQIEQDADKIFFLYRHEYYLRQREPKPSEQLAHEDALAACQNRVDFIVRKNRKGTEGSAVADFYGRYQAMRG